MPSIYIINPANSSPNYHSAEFFSQGGVSHVQVADLAIVTVAAFVPSDWQVRVVEESLSPVDLDAPEDFIAITGKVSQRNRMVALADEFRRRGKTVIIGGSFASLTPDEMRPHADILVTGEIEEIAPAFFADLASGEWKDRYEGGKADIRLSPIPRWDLYPVDQALLGAVQTTRGCPFTCEFCDVIQYQGRKQRHKDVAQVMAELDALHAHGFRQVFIVDDNFTVHRAFARTMLDAMAEWNRAHADDPLTFLTQASLDVARDEDMLERCRQAGLKVLFLGIETVNEDSLRETGKKQNLLAPITEVIDKVVRSGIAVQGGIIVGFDHDTPAIFGAMADFFEASPIAEFDIGVLTAPHATDLYRRMKAEGRLLGAAWETTAGHPFETNIVPAGMTREELMDGAARLCAHAYAPERFGARLIRMIEMLGEGAGPTPKRAAGQAERTRQFFGMLQRISALGPREAKMVKDVLHAAGRKPSSLTMALHFLSKYGQIRYFLESTGAVRFDGSADGLGLGASERGVQAVGEALQPA